MNFKSINLYLGLLIIIFIVLYLFSQCSSSHQTVSSTNNKSEVQPSPINNKNNHTEPKVKQEAIENKVERTQEKNPRDDINITECDKSADIGSLLSHKYFDEQAIELANNTEKLIPILEQSPNMESQIAYALITASDDITKLSDKFQLLNNEYSDNKLLSYDLLSLCTHFH